MTDFTFGFVDELVKLSSPGEAQILDRLAEKALPGKDVHPAAYAGAGAAGGGIRGAAIGAAGLGLLGKKGKLAKRLLKGGLIGGAVGGGIGTAGGVAVGSKVIDARRQQIGRTKVAQHPGDAAKDKLIDAAKGGVAYGAGRGALTGTILGLLLGNKGKKLRAALTLGGIGTAGGAIARGVANPLIVAKKGIKKIDESRKA